VQKSVLVVMSLVGCAVEPGGTGVKPPPASLTRVTAVAPGEPVVLRVDGATGAVVHFARGAAVVPAGTCPAGIAPSCLDLRAPRQVGSATVDASGAAELRLWVPAGAPVGASIVVQAVAGPGLVTNTLTLTVGEPIAVAGAWDDAWGGYAEIDHTRWRDGWGGVWHLLDHGDGWAIAQNDVANPYFPGLFSRFDWTTQGGQSWYCQTAYAAPSAAAAAATAPADSSAPTSGGCGGFPWTAWAPAGPEVAGAWTDAFGTAHTIDADVWDQGWSAWDVASFSNLDTNLIARNRLTNPYFPGRWSRFDWTWSAGDLFYCQTAYDAVSERAARETPAADAADLAAGCGGFGWTALIP
jgi:hypothetical protein